MMRQRTVSEAATARGATGFLKPRQWHAVHVGVMGRVHNGTNARDAARAVHRWRALSAAGEGRAAGQPVRHYIDGVLQPEPPKP